MMAHHLFFIKKISDLEIGLSLSEIPDLNNVKFLKKIKQGSVLWKSTHVLLYGLLVVLCMTKPGSLKHIWQSGRHDQMMVVKFFDRPVLEECTNAFRCHSKSKNYLIY